MTRIATIRRTFVLPLLLGGLLVACGDDGGTPSSGTGTTKDTGPAAVPVAPEAAPDMTLPAELPEVVPITVATARGVLRSSLTALPPGGSTESFETGVRVLGYLADLGDAELADAVRSKLLVKEDGEYDDLEYAAIGWATLHRAGESGAAQKLLDVARLALDQDEGLVVVAQALGSLTGEHTNASDKLLVELIEADLDDEASTEATRILASRHSKAGREAFHLIAANEELDDGDRAVAVAGLLALGDPRAQPIVDAWIGDVEESADLDDVLAGLGVESVTEAVPAIQAIMKAVEERSTFGWEPAMACLALGTIYKGGGGEEHLGLVRHYMAVPDAQADAEGGLALLRMGDPGGIDAVVGPLEHQVKDPARGDVELAVEILETLAARGLAGDERLAKAVNVGAFVAPPTDMPENLRTRGRGVNYAAAYAYLKSQK